MVEVNQRAARGEVAICARAEPAMLVPNQPRLPPKMKPKPPRHQPRPATTAPTRITPERRPEYQQCDGRVPRGPSPCSGQLERRPEYQQCDGLPRITAREESVRGRPSRRQCRRCVWRNYGRRHVSSLRMAQLWRAACADRFETTCRRVSPPIFVVSPAYGSVVAAYGATMAAACADCFETHLSARQPARPIVGSPADGSVVAAYGATMAVACADRFETTCRRVGLPVRVEIPSRRQCRRCVWRNYGRSLR